MSDKYSPENSDFIKNYETAVEEFEKYEETVMEYKNTGQLWENAMDYQQKCLNVIKSMIHAEKTDMYLISLMNIRRDLLKHGEIVDIKRTQKVKLGVKINNIKETSNESHFNFTRQETYNPPRKLAKMGDSRDSKPTCNSMKHCVITPKSMGLLKLEKTFESKSTQIRVPGVTITKINETSYESYLNLQYPTSEQNDNPPRKVAKIDDCRVSEPMHNSMTLCMTKPKSKGLCDVAGMQKPKTLLKEAVVFPRQFPHLFTGARKPWNKALLYGPPGTGKTHLAHSIAAEINAQFYSITTADLLSRFVGESEKFVRSLFQSCQNNIRYSMIFIDEVDSFCRRRNTAEAQRDRRLKNELLNQLSGIDKTENNNIFFLAATNCPWDLDPAFIRRFQRRIYIPLPDRETRLKLIELHVNTVSNSVTDEQWPDILDRTEGWSGSDIADLINCAMYGPLKELENARHWVLTAEGKYLPTKEKTALSIERALNTLPPNQVTVRAVEKQDFLAALSTVTKTVTSEEIRKYEEFNETFGTVKAIAKD